MRTTLKRGIGRGVSVNGNGRAVYPPGVRSPMTLYGPEPRRRSRLALVGRILLWLLAAIVILAAGLVGGAYLYFHQKVSDIQAHTPAMKIAVRKLDTPLPNAPATALVVGYDHRAGVEKNLPSRSDTIMLIRADPQTKTISLLSLPRDLLTTIYCPGKPPYEDRINAAFSICRQIGTLETVKHLTGLSINYLITVDFHGFKVLVDKLGGVWIDVDRHYLNTNSGLVSGVNTFATINLQPGYQKLNGSNALDFVRYRHTDSDLYRVARQQAFVRAVKEQVSHQITPTNLPFELPKLVNALTSNIEVGGGGGSAISGRTILSYLLFAYELPAGHLFQPRIENLQQAGPFGAELSASTADVQAAMAQFVRPDVNAPKTATDVALGRKPRAPRGPRPQNVTITVLNGNGVVGSAASAAYELAMRNYRILVPPNGVSGNAPTFNYFHTEVYFDPRVPQGRAAARGVANLFGDADVGVLPTAVAPKANGALLTVVVGQTFHGTLAPAPVDQTPKSQPAYVSSNPGATIGLLTPLRRRVPFRLEYPGLLEKTSFADPEVPVRVYPIASGHKAVRLVFKTASNANEYWGIEETDWTDAPILQRPNQTLHLGGRRFDLYYAGPRLHMVVLRESGATYWVVNTLLDRLSNETMLAMAKSLRPLGK